MTQIRQFLILLTAASFLSACASSEKQVQHDPFETFNRTVFAFNEGVDTILLRPAAKTYRFIAPLKVRKGLRNAFRNANEPLNSLNALLQGDVTHFLTSSWRFVLNTTFGLGGLYDFAGEYAGLPYRREDFGQTLAVWTGEQDSTYLVLPIFGPSNVRDTVGTIVDTFTTPWYYLLEDEAAIAYAATKAVVQREQMMDQIDDLYDSSFDPYSSFRSAYEQRRNAQIRNRYQSNKK